VSLVDYHDDCDRIRREEQESLNWLCILKSNVTYLREVREEFWLEAGSGKLLVEQCDLDGLGLVLRGLAGVLDLNLLHQLLEEILVEVSAKALRQLKNHIK